MTLREILVRAYPRSWRAEYGEELGAILGQRTLSVRVVANVLAGAFRQHLRRDEPWKICGAFLVVWMSLGVFLRPGLLYEIPVPVILAAGAWSFWRKRLGIWDAAIDAVKVTILSLVPDALSVVLNGPAVVRWSGGTVVYRWGAYITASSAVKFGWWQYVEMLPLVLLVGIMMGLAGGLIGKFAVRVREGSPA